MHIVMHCGWRPRFSWLAIVVWSIVLDDSSRNRKDILARMGTWSSWGCWHQVRAWTGSSSSVRDFFQKWFKVDQNGSKGKIVDSPVLLLQFFQEFELLVRNLVGQRVVVHRVLHGDRFRVPGSSRRRRWLDDVGDDDVRRCRHLAQHRVVWSHRLHWSFSTDRLVAATINIPDW